MNFDVLTLKTANLVAINLLIFLFTLCVNLLITRYIISHKKRINKIQSYSIRARDIHSEETPRLGGLAFYASFFLSIWFSNLFFTYTAEDKRFFLNTALILSIALLCGILDDLFNMGYIHKLIFQLLIALSIVRCFGYMHTLIFPGFTSRSIPIPIGIAVTILLVLIIINGINFIDGMDALAGGVILIGSIVLYLHSMILYQALHLHLYLIILLLYAALIAILSSFLHYNKPPAKIFMGETGVLFLGTIIAILLTSIFNYLGDIKAQYTIFSSERALVHKYNTLYIPILMFLPSLIVPLLDLTSTVLLRLANRSSPMIADNNHIHHRLMMYGYSYRGTLLSIYTVSMYIGALSLFFSIYSLKHYFLYIAIILTVLTFMSLSIITQTCRK